MRERERGKEGERGGEREREGERERVQRDYDSASRILSFALVLDNKVCPSLLQWSATATVFSSCRLVYLSTCLLVYLSSCLLHMLPAAYAPQARQQECVKTKTTCIKLTLLLHKLHKLDSNSVSRKHVWQAKHSTLLLHKADNTSA